MLTPTQLEDGESYATADEILACTDLPEATLRIPQWRRNGRPLVIRVRALSLEDKEAILQEARQRDGSISTIARVESTLFYTCISPKLTRPQAAQLRHKNPTALESIVDFVWVLSALDQDLIDAAVQELTGAEPPADSGT
mgnify:CR=1 FL=1